MAIGHEINVCNSGAGASCCRCLKSGTSNFIYKQEQVNTDFFFFGGRSGSYKISNDCGKKNIIGKIQEESLQLLNEEALKNLDES